MNKAMFEFILEQHFEQFELGDSIQVGESQIYFEFSRYGSDIKLRIPFEYGYFQRNLEKIGANYIKRDLEVVSAISYLKTKILENLLDLSEGEEDE